MTLSELERLSPQLCDSDGQVQVTLDFGTDLEGQAYVKGAVSANLSLICQRCMQPMDYPVESQFSLGVVKDADAIEKLSSQYEPLLVREDGTVETAELIEEELLLSLPIVPKHKECI
ncbi:MAG: DUF177 domain-containing protein [Proteobacteria bacterium]|nr:DUF177 domain-containing protein [Pseudomonadota bacterium]